MKEKPKPILKVVGAAIESNGKFLCVKRGECKNQQSSYRYEFPGGKVEQGESPEAALNRELLEELELDIPITPQDYFTTSVCDFGDKIIELQIYLVHASNIAFSLKEHIRFDWVSPKDLLKLEWSPADVPAVKLLMKKDF